MTDYIDRQAALNIAEEECDRGTPYDIPMKLENLPAADVRENVRGKWITHGEPPLYVIECSCCGQRYFNHAMQCLANYCSHCGANMKGGQDG